ncbi:MULTISPECIES: carboxymuconolactone decarboxylase family protein [Ramlibacter]|uniref:Carboxymuconolactone decarboxylase family protein n=1 Tax=Ramlibacter pinisoli TaxID=2682844 RepID=A0A6N8IQD8_9BURK|nr:MULTISPECIES: carboxymuconolactone decarboxylase family protein [Ramlibacter]MBA2963533.1 carboxymuconolactone decarboxylase family protein [Ramlibacter sp. CGMCC 1.13660]MVQ28500.1 carboxymuconolactone decarboxylase family protein [Ramlibacter pinisoli]
MTAPATARRFAPLELDAMTPEQRFVAQGLIDGPRGGIRGPFHALLRNPRLADRVRTLGDSIRFENSLPAALREFVILLVARFWSARYEWHAHSKMAVEAGVDQSVIDAIGQGRTPQGMTADQALLHRFISELLQDKDVSDGTYAQALERFGEPALLDVLCTAGYFSFVSLILNTIRQPVPEGGVQLPALDAAR